MAEETHKIGGYTIEMDTDDCDYYDPITENDSFIFAIGTRRYISHNAYIIRQYAEGRRRTEAMRDPDDFAEWGRRQGRDIIYALPVYAYIHGGIVLSNGPFSCQWDSSFIGFMYVTRQIIEDTRGWKRLSDKRRKRLDESAANILTSYNAYAAGDVWRFKILDADGEEVEQMGGFIGDEKGALAEATSLVEYYIKQDREKRTGRLKNLIRQKVPLSVRAGVLSNFV